MYEDIKTACLYVRFSSHNQTEQSIEGQTRVCRDFCKRHNIRIVEIYADRATSASKDIEKRVQFLKMIKDSEKGLFDAVIVYKLDRFARSRYDSATYKYRLKRNGVQLISATENISNDPEGIILESVLEGMAEFYSAELSQKINRGMRESAYKHNSIGGAVPLGYKIEDKKLVIDPKTAPIVKEAFEKYADGETVAEICRQFNARGYKTSKGTAFGKSSFTKIFRNERYIGVYSFHDYRAEDAIPAIIDKDLWDRVQLRVGKIKNAPARNKAKVVYLLSGKIFCGHCGSKMNGNCNAGNYYYYQCYGKKNGNVDCKKKNIRKEFIERLVAQDALSLLTDEYIEQIATIACEKNQHEIELDSALPTIRDRIHQVDLSLNNLLKAIESGSAPDMLVKRMGELEKEKKDLQVQAKKESEDIVELDKAQVIYWLEQFRGGSIEDEEFCRMLIDLFVNSVTVWDEDDNTYKVTVAYNLTSLPTKTYRLNKGGTLSDFTSNAPVPRADAVPIFLGNPPSALFLVPALCPLPETIINLIVDFAECFSGHNKSLVIDPATDNRVELANQGILLCRFVALDDFAHLFQQRTDRLLRGFDKEFSVVFSNILAQEVKSIFDVGDNRLFFGQLQSTFSHKLSNNRKDFFAQKFRAFSGYDKVVSIAHKVHLIKVSFPIEVLFGRQSFL